MFEVNNKNSKESHEINRNLVALKSHNIYFSQGHPVTPKASLLSIFLQLYDISGECRRGGSRTAATSKMERFVIIVNGCKPSTIITKYSILDVLAVLDPPRVLPGVAESPVTKKLWIDF